MEPIKFHVQVNASVEVTDTRNSAAFASLAIWQAGTPHGDRRTPWDLERTAIS